MNLLVTNVKHFWHKHNGHSFTASCPDCQKRIRLTCGYDITRAATGKVRLDGWTGHCSNCRKLYDATSYDIDVAIRKV